MGPGVLALLLHPSVPGSDPTPTRSHSFRRIIHWFWSIVNTYSLSNHALQHPLPGSGTGHTTHRWLISFKLCLSPAQVQSLLHWSFFPAHPSSLTQAFPSPPLLFSLTPQISMVPTYFRLWCRGTRGSSQEGKGTTGAGNQNSWVI